MKPPVPVPHRNQLPTTQFGHPYSIKNTAPDLRDDFEEAMELVHQEFNDYQGYPKFQQELVDEAMDDLAFRREVRQAANRIAGVAVVSPVYTYEGLRVKDETQQLTKAYKLRGATNFILKHEAVANQAGVITASAGNHGQAVALAAAKIGVEAIVVVPEGTPATKRDGIESHGGRVIVYGQDYAAANQKALELNTKRQGLYAPAYNNRDIMAGQATMGLELLKQTPDMTDLIVPTGGGGALAGIAKLLRTTKPSVRVWGSGVEGSSALATAFINGNGGRTAPTHFADGIAVSQLGSLTWPEIKRSVEGALTVKELDLRRWVGHLSLAGRVIEGAGAVGIAAALQHRANLGSRPVTIATGGNIDPQVLRACQLLAMGSRRTD